MTCMWLIYTQKIKKLQIFDKKTIYKVTSLKFHEKNKSKSCILVPNDVKNVFEGWVGEKKRNPWAPTHREKYYIKREYKRVL